MRIKPFQAEYPRVGRIGSPDDFCERAKDLYPDYRKARLVEQFPENAFYIYRIRAANRIHTGLVCIEAVSDYLEGHIKKHEKTILAREQHQMELFLSWDALLKPVLMTFPPLPALSALLDACTEMGPPLLELYFEADKETHQVWAVTDSEAIAALQTIFERDIPNVYVADGHHRVTAIAFMHEHLRKRYPNLDVDHLFCAFFAADQLTISDFNRVIEIPVETSAVKPVLEHLASVFDVRPLKEAAKPERQHQLIAYFEQQWYELEWKKSALEPWYAKEEIVLDAALLNVLVLRGLLGIQDVRNDRRIHYIEGKKGLDGIRRLADQGPGRIGFALFPVSFEAMARLADHGKSLPPKSTYFEPRLKTGLLVKRLGA